MKKYIIEFVEIHDKTQSGTFCTYGLPKLKLVKNGTKKQLVYEIKLVEDNSHLQMDYCFYRLNSIMSVN